MAELGNWNIPGGVTGYVGVASQVLGMFTNLAGASQSASASRAAAERARVAAQFDSQQLEQNAGQAFAAGQAAAVEQLRQNRLLQSRAIALIAASGGGASDETVVNLLARNAGEGAYRAQLAVYQGEEKARQLRLAASTRTYEGELQGASMDDKAKAYRIAGAGQFTRDSASLYSKYWKPDDIDAGKTAVYTNSGGTGFVNEG
jgi:hypothetical protein